MIKFYKETEQDKVYREIIGELPEVKTLDRGYKFGAASVIASLDDWCEELKELGIEKVSLDDIKAAFVGWVSFDDELKLIFNRLMSHKNR